MNFYYAFVAFAFFLSLSEMIEQYLLFIETKDVKHIGYASRTSFIAAIAFGAIIGKILHVI